MFFTYLGVLSSLSDTLKYLFNKFRTDDNIPNSSVSLHGGINESHLASETLSKRNTESNISRRVKRDDDEQDTETESKEVVEKSEFNIDFLKY